MGQIWDGILASSVEKWGVNGTLGMNHLKILAEFPYLELIVPGNPQEVFICWTIFEWNGTWAVFVSAEETAKL